MPSLRSEETIDRKHFLGRESFYVELHREATLSEDLQTILDRRTQCIAIYLGDGVAHTKRTIGNNERVGITLEMAEWLYDALGAAITAAQVTDDEFARGAESEES